MQLPKCAKAGKTADECGNEMLTNVMQNMNTILDAVHESNPQMKVVGFGYDIMFGDVGCSAMTHSIFPQCWKDGDEVAGARCFVRLKAVAGVWNKLSRLYPS